MYEYSAIVRYVFDGDTYKLDVDLGFGMWCSGVIVRLDGVDTPQTFDGNPKGIAAKTFVMKMIHNKEVTIRSVKVKKGKYTLWNVVVLYEEPESGSQINLNEQLLANGLGEKFKKRDKDDPR